MKVLRATTSVSQLKPTKHDPSLPHPTQADQPEVSLQPTKQGLVMKQKTFIATIEDMLDDLLAESARRTNIYMVAKLKQIEGNFNTVQQLHNKICAEDIAYDLEEYLATEASIWDRITRAKKFKKVSHHHPKTHQLICQG